MARKGKGRRKVQGTGKAEHATYALDPEVVRQRMEHRRSGAAGSHDSRPRGQRTRQGARRAAIQMASY